MRRSLTAQATSCLSAPKPYRFGFIVSTGMGNMTRYLNFRKYAERDAEVDLVWAPVKHFIAPDEPNPFRYLPEPFYTRAVILYQSYPVLQQMQRLDAVLFHMFEAYVVACLRNMVRQQPLLIWNNDDPPIVNPDTYPLYSKHFNKSLRRHKFRLNLDLWCASRTAAFIPWSAWGNSVFVNECGIAPDRVHSIHPGLDLEHWTRVSRPPLNPDAKPKILFVGGDFVRKGGELLLQVFSQHFVDRAELHLVTKEPPETNLPNVFIYTDMGPNDARLTRLYAQADLFVLPTTADLSSWACLEAMASSCPVISTAVGGVADIIQPGETGLLVTVGEAEALVAAIRSLLDRPELRQQMGLQGRHVVERDFNAAVNVPLMLKVMKDAVEQKRMLAMKKYRPH